MYFAGQRAQLDLVSIVLVQCFHGEIVYVLQRFPQTIQMFSEWCEFLIYFHTFHRDGADPNATAMNIVQIEFSIIIFVIT